MNSVKDKVSEKIMTDTKNCIALNTHWKVDDLVYYNIRLKVFEELHQMLRLLLVKISQ